jgi:zinc/manganese transport system substrate-binding protein
MILKKLRTSLVSAVIAGLTLAPAGAGASSSPIVVSGVSQWGALAAQVLHAPLNASSATGAGPRAYSLLTDPNADPHEHEATPHDAEMVSRATLVIESGAGYDTWLSALVKARGVSASSVINVGTLAGIPAGKNPHLFYDPRNAILLTKALVQHLGSRLTPGATSTLLSLNTLQATAQRVRTACAGVKVAATEDVASYLLEDMGLNIVTPENFRLAIGNGVDPSVQDLATTLQQLSQHPAFLIDNTQTQTPLTSQVVSQALADHVPVIKVTETMVGDNYTTWLSGVITKIKTVLTHEGCLH